MTKPCGLGAWVSRTDMLGWSRWGVMVWTAWSASSWVGVSRVVRLFGALLGGEGGEVVAHTKAIAKEE